MINTKAHPFQALDACHLLIQESMVELERLVKRMETQGLDNADRKLAGKIEAFFSSTSRKHHAQEEAEVFPPLLVSGSEEIKTAVRILQQDHGFIEENWIVLGPQLRAIAEGNDWYSSEEFQHNVATFLELLDGHIALEESMVYPESKAQWTAAVAARKAYS